MSQDAELNWIPFLLSLGRESDLFCVHKSFGLWWNFIRGFLFLFTKQKKNHKFTILQAGTYAEKGPGVRTSQKFRLFLVN